MGSDAQPFRGHFEILMQPNKIYSFLKFLSKTTTYVVREHVFRK